jgi:hypothetical protein
MFERVAFDGGPLLFLTSARKYTVVMVDPKSVKIRVLRFHNIEQCRVEVNRLLKADEDGRLFANGNWTPGQIFDHLGTWINWGYVGYPKEIGGPPWMIRVILKLFRGYVLKSKAPQGFRMPGVKNGTFAFEHRDIREAAADLLRGLQRLEAGAPPFASPAFGMMSREEAVALHLRHCELHLGYLDVR